MGENDPICGASCKYKNLRKANREYPMLFPEKNFACIISKQRYNNWIFDSEFLLRSKAPSLASKVYITVSTELLIGLIFVSVGTILLYEHIFTAY